MISAGNILEKPSSSRRKLWGQLTCGKYRRKEGLFLAEGFKVVTELFRSRWRAESLLIREDRADHYRQFIASLPTTVSSYAVTPRDWERLSQDKNSEGIMAVVVDRPSRNQGQDFTDRRGQVLFLDRISNPGNLGAIIRSAHWFGIRELAISSGSVDYTNPKVVRTSMGSLFHLNISADVAALDYLARLRKDYLLVATLSRGGINPRPCRQPTVLIMGNESHGLPEEILAMAEERWTLPGCGEAESLSLPQAAAIVMYECTRLEQNGGRQ